MGSRRIKDCRKRPQPNTVIGGDQDGPHRRRDRSVREAQPYFREMESGFIFCHAPAALVESTLVKACKTGHEGHNFPPSRLDRWVFDIRHGGAR